jgi:hypothetical protein
VNRGKRLDRAELIRRIRALTADMPPLDAAPEVRAAWLDRQAAIYDDVARIDRSATREARIFAAKSRRKAAELRGGTDHATDEKGKDGDAG